MTSVTKNLRRVLDAASGIWFALRHDYSYRLQAIGGAVAIGIFVYFFRPLSETELLFLGLAWVLILITELQNSAFESALDHLHPELHDNIGRSKGMAAGAVLTAGLFFLFVMTMIVVI